MGKKKRSLKTDLWALLRRCTAPDQNRIWWDFRCLLLEKVRSRPLQAGITHCVLKCWCDDVGLSGRPSGSQHEVHFRPLVDSGGAGEPSTLTDFLGKSRLSSQVKYGLWIRPESASPSWTPPPWCFPCFWHIHHNRRIGSKNCAEQHELIHEPELSE